MIAWSALALAVEVPVAVQHLQPGTPVRPQHLRWVELDDGHDLVADALDDPVGHIVVERVLAGEILRSERLLDVDKPERIAVPGMRALRVAGVDPRLDLEQTRRADLWVVGPSEPCTVVQGSWILGIGRDVAGAPDSTFLLVTPEQAFQAMAGAMSGLLQVRAVSPSTAGTPRPELACSR